MRKYAVIFISYIFLVSKISPINYDFTLRGEASILPYSVSFNNTHSIAGLAGCINYSSLFNHFGVGMEIGDMYRTINLYTNDTGNFKGAFNNLYGTLFFIAAPIEQLHITIGNYFVWNRSAYEFDSRGTITENRFGTGAALNFLLYPFINYENQKGGGATWYHTIEFSLHNKFSLYFYTRSSTLQYEYNGYIRASIPPFVDYIKPYTDLGVLYYSHDTEAGKFDSVALSWSVGADFGYSWKYSSKVKPVAQDLTTDKMPEPEPEVVPSATTPTSSVPVKSAFYQSLEKYGIGDIIRIENVFFPNNSAIQGQGISLLKEIAEYLLENKNIIILVTGYAEDNIKYDEDIIKIAALRSTLIRNYFINKGIDAERIKRSSSALTYDVSKGLEPFIEIKILKK